MNPLPEFCSCGNAFVLRRRTRRDQALYFTCLHCDGICKSDLIYVNDYLSDAQEKIVRGAGCTSCVLLTIDRTDAPDGAL